MIVQGFFDDTKIIEVYLTKDNWSIFPTRGNFRNKAQEEGIIQFYGELKRINIFIKDVFIIHYQDTLNRYVLICIITERKN